MLGEDGVRVTPLGFNQGGGAILERFSTANKATLLDALATIARSSQGSGVSDGEILIALSKGRHELDPFGVFCKVHGNLVHFLGPVIGLVVYVGSLLALFKVLSGLAVTAGEFLAKVIEKYWVYFAIGAAAVGAGALFLRDGSGSSSSPRDFEERLRSLATNGLAGFVFGFFPGPLAGMLNGMKDDISELLSPGGGGGAQPMRTAYGSENPFGSLGITDHGGEAA